MKKSIIIAALGIIISIVGFVKGDTALAVIVLLVFLGVAAVLFLKDKKKGAPSEGRSDEEQMKDNIDGWHLAYSYNHKLCIVKGESAPGKDKVGSELSFIPEPDNEFDKLAVKVCIGSERIGYVYRSDHQDMIHDYINRGWLVKGKLVSSGNDARYAIGFYKPMK